MTTTEDPMVAYVRQLRERHEQQLDAVRTRTLAMGYAFGRADERRAVTGEAPESAPGAPFADFYEQHTDGRWSDLNDQFTAFESRKDTPK